MAPEVTADYTFINRSLSIYLGLITVSLFVAFCHQRQLKSTYAIWAVVVLAVGLQLFNARHDILDKGYWRMGKV